MPGVRLEGVADAIPVGTIYCVGRNYRAHAMEMGSDIPTEPVLFIKPSGALLGEDEPIRLPSFSQEVHHEVEMVALIGMEGKDIPRADALDYVIGYGVGLDLTARDLQAEAKRKGLPWTVSKGFDGAAPISRFARLAALGPPGDLELTLSVNGQVRQRTSTALMIFPVDQLIAHISTIFTLRSGDLVFTGTPEGVGPIRPGDHLELTLGPATGGVPPGATRPGVHGGVLRARFDVAGGP